MAKAKGRLRGKTPKLSSKQEKLLVGLWRAGNHTTQELAELFLVARSTVYRAIQRSGIPTEPAPSVGETLGGQSSAPENPRP